MANKLKACKKWRLPRKIYLQIGQENPFLKRNPVNMIER